MRDIDVVTIVQADGIDRLLMDHPEMRRVARKIMAKVLRKARGRVAKDMKGSMKEDPRAAYRAVKHAVYKRVLGGNISILAKRRASSVRVNLERKRTLVEGQVGGNRIKRTDDNRNRLEHYYGSDRGFILRFLNSGTSQRQSRFGYRGEIAGRDRFGTISSFQLETAAEEFANAIADEINKLNNITNGE